jgi:hypothetical protein
MSSGEIFALVSPVSADVDGSLLSPFNVFAPFSFVGVVAEDPFAFGGTLRAVVVDIREGVSHVYCNHVVSSLMEDDVDIVGCGAEDNDEGEEDNKRDMYKVSLQAVCNSP